MWAGMVEERTPQAEGKSGSKAMMGSSGEGWLPGSTGGCVGWGGGGPQEMRQRVRKNSEGHAKEHTSVPQGHRATGTP